MQQVLLASQNTTLGQVERPAESKVLRLAVQKKGRLSDQSIALLKHCGINVFTGGALCAPAANYPLELLLLRDDDIPKYVREGIADIGIVGENVLLESSVQDGSLKVVESLGFGKCRLSLAVPRDTDYTDINWFEGRRIATTYPLILKDFLERKGVQASVESISGSVEIAPNIGLADGICDIVSTGSTLRANGLKEVEEVMRSQAVMIAGEGLGKSASQLLDKLLFRIRAVQKASSSKYILLNAPDSQLEEIASILPGIKSPTVLPLLREGWSSLHSVVQEDRFWDVIDQLRLAGAEGVLVCEIEKVIV